MRAALVLTVLLATACEPAPGSEGPCSPDTISASCVATIGYGSPCTVPCSSPRSCTFTVIAQWSGTGTECCARLPPVAYHDCVCEDGVAVCGSGERRERPSSLCECHGLRSGSGIDAGDAAP